MFIEILVAALIATAIELVYYINSFMKPIILIFFCICSIVIYIISDYQLDFIGTMNFSVWLIFIILFDQIFTIILHRIYKNISDDD